MPYQAPEGLLVFETKEAVQRWRAELRRSDRSLGFVPTMGYLHEGHLSLIHEARSRADAVLVSIFVNPTQFGPNEDLDAYPRDIDGDLQKAYAAGCESVFLPSVTEMYPPGSQTMIQAGELGNGLCGSSRPTHFSGVCTVVAKLFNITQCDVAVFGQKDYQQLAIIRQMVRDLDLPVEVLAGPIVREADGLAMSSRNAYLSPEDRREAVALSLALADVRAAWGAGERDPIALQAVVSGRFRASESGLIDYIEVVDSTSLRPFLGRCVQDTLVALAIRYGDTRLIDNTLLSI